MSAGLSGLRFADRQSEGYPDRYPKQWYALPKTYNRSIRNSPYLPKIPVHGLVIDINTGKLEMVDRAAA